ncbi:MAG: hypothetical protein LBM00_04055 [Deltaproteobacteria bacterium]|nr:hypothetical protein [Deltaproteobacteria bacterium]
MALAILAAASSASYADLYIAVSGFLPKGLKKMERRGMTQANLRPSLADGAARPGKIVLPLQPF